MAVAYPCATTLAPVTVWVPCQVGATSPPKRSTIRPVEASSATAGVVCGWIEAGSAGETSAASFEPSGL